MPDDVAEVQTESGAMRVHITRPSGSGPGPLVVVYMDAAGVRDVLHAVAARLAAAGYLVAVPDLYYRLDPEQRPDPAHLLTGDSQEFARMGAAVRSVEEEVVMADTRLLIEQLASAEPMAGDGWGCVGFCLGGRLGLVAADRFGEAIRAASLLHPARIVTDSPDSPHRHLGGVRSQLYFGFGAEDHVTPPSTIPPLRKELDRHHITYRLDVLPDADHGFMMPGAPVYNRDAAEHAWRETLDLLTRALPVAG